ncbi:hypothetical protein HK105_202292 [Polyrhizophydium stewartii]|uniref:L domain-like protein n=1 Tax=Polyrhizophydium stewartii TaxID=2732419 RepID=A0ABR4NFR6_9FUNG
MPLSGNLPRGLYRLKALTYLNLSRNSFSGSIPDEYGSFSILQELYLNENVLTGTIPSSLGSLSRLRILHLSYNSLSGNAPSSFSNLGSIVQMEVHDTGIGGSFTGTFPSLNICKLDSHMCASANIATLCSSPVCAVAPAPAPVPSQAPAPAPSANPGSPQTSAGSPSQPAPTSGATNPQASGSASQPQASNGAALPSSSSPGQPGSGSNGNGSGSNGSGSNGSGSNGSSGNGNGDNGSTRNTDGSNSGGGSTSPGGANGSSAVSMPMIAGIAAGVVVVAVGVGMFVWSRSRGQSTQQRQLDLAPAPRGTPPPSAAIEMNNLPRAAPAAPRSAAVASDSTEHLMDLHAAQMPPPYRQGTAYGKAMQSQTSQPSAYSGGYTGRGIAGEYDMEKALLDQDVPLEARVVGAAPTAALDERYKHDDEMSVSARTAAASLSAFGSRGTVAERTASSAPTGGWAPRHRQRKRDSGITQTSGSSDDRHALREPARAMSISGSDMRSDTIRELPSSASSSTDLREMPRRDSAQVGHLEAIREPLMRR